MNRHVTPTLAGLFLLAAGALAAEAPPAVAPPMAQGTATITEMNHFALFNTSAYSLTLGSLQIRADRRGPPCVGFASGQTIQARYNDKEIILEREAQRCELKVRRMEFTDAPQASSPER